MNVHNNPACQGCTYDGGIQCLSKVKSKQLKYKKTVDGNNIYFQLISCNERRILEQATS